MMKNAFFFGLLLFAFSSLFGQNQEADAGLIFDDSTYLGDIRSVRCFGRGREVEPPIVRLGEQILMQFDQMGSESHDFFFQLVHCGRDWKPTPELETTDFLEGYAEGQIRDFDFSMRTRQPYVHYHFSVPNQDMKPTISGNFLLKIYAGEDEERELAITRRIVFYENAWTVAGESVQAQNVSKLRTHNEIDFKITAKNPRPNNPMREIRAVVLQNGAWPTAIETEPFFEKGPSDISFDHSDKIVFPAGHEWRLCDLRNLDMRSEHVQKIEKSFSKFEVWMKPDHIRSNGQSFSLGDINGQFFLENKTPNGSWLESEYVLTNFRLEAGQAFHEKEVYLFGAFSEWKIKPELRLFYDEKTHEYVGQAFLKQGAINYEYALFDPKTGKVDLEEIEGNWWETENDYQILAYWRPFGGRFDRAMGFGFLNTRRN